MEEVASSGLVICSRILFLKMCRERIVVCRANYSLYNIEHSYFQFTVCSLLGGKLDWHYIFCNFMDQCNLQNM